MATGFVDRPGPTKSHSRETPYLGGVGIAAVALGAYLLHHDLSRRLVVVAVAAAAVTLVGLIDDARGLGPWVRLSAETAAAGAVVAAGVRAMPTDIVALNVALTIVWIVGVTNAFNLMDNMDGLAAGAALVSATGVFALAAFGDQDRLALAAAGLAGACAGFLVHNWRPASIFMGDAGALFLGFLLAVAVLDVSPAPARPWSYGVPVLLVALALFDTALVSFARYRRGRTVMSGGKDHCSHRLVANGLLPGAAVTLLIAVQAALSTLGVLAGRAVVSVWAALLIGAVVLATLGAVVARAPVYDTPAIGFRARLLQTRRRLAGSPVVAMPAHNPARHDGTAGRSEIPL